MATRKGINISGTYVVCVCACVCVCSVGSIGILETF